MVRPQSKRRLTIAAAVGLACLSAIVAARHAGTMLALAAEPEAPKKLDPAAWGSDHVGQGVPAYMEGGECLFCHRNDVGGEWQTDKHNRTIRDAPRTEPAMEALAEDPGLKDFVDQVELLMGDTRAQRFLKRADAYGKVDLLSPVATFGRGRRARLEETDNPHWEIDTFALECAGCHTTAVNPETHAFSTVALDCYACHGVAPDGHTEDAKQILLNTVQPDSPAVVTSICGSCHIRFGKSKSSGLPYPNNFVPGDNLFKDFQVDFDVADDETLNPADRHVMHNVREVVVRGNESMTCLSCHDVHQGSSAKHRDLPVVNSCQHCHSAATPIKSHKRYQVHSERCQY
ncbi:MAG: hypothetical protein DWQ37_13295 [Planctomycetota bacterium]|nr:MAG: hypothetical protein DWQ37_13295 [Planctomycetota bacterium]